MSNFLFFIYFLNAPRVIINFKTLMSMPLANTQIFFMVMVLALLLCAFMPYLERRIWWVRAFDFVRIQGFLLALLLFMLSPFLMGTFVIVEYLLLALIIVTLSVQGYYLYPYTKLHSKEVPDGNKQDHRNQFTLMLSNVLMPNNNYVALLDLVDELQPDVLVCMETSQQWHQALDGLHKKYSHSISEPNQKMYGMHVFSKLPLSDIQVKHLVQEKVPSIHVFLDLNGSKIMTHFMHPAPPSPSENDESTERDAELLALARKLKDMPEPLLVAGDLNDVPWSKPLQAFKRISGLRDVRVGRRLLNTFHATMPFLRWPLDHVFVSKHFNLMNLQRHRLAGSDHFAVTAELALVTDAALVENRNVQAKSQVYADEVMAEKNISEQDVPK